MSIRNNQKTVVQTLVSPMQGLDEVVSHVEALHALVEWNQVGILFDEVPSTVLILMLNEGAVVAVCRFCLPLDESVSAMRAYCDGIAEVVLRCYQDHTFSIEDVTNLVELEAYWEKCSEQSDEVALDEIINFFKKIEDATRAKGRSANFTVDTIRQVFFDAHGRCMFEGCANDLTIDPVTGVRGNYAYLAHNVATSELGPRGILYLSEMLSDEPDNILLLCDIHHRLVDVIAKTDFPASKLSEMRNRFCADANTLLDGLKVPCVPAFLASWPVHCQVVSAPTQLQVTQSLADINLRSDGPLRVLSNNDAILRDADPENIWGLIPSSLEVTAATILAQSESNSYRAALYAIGLMPSLIALGALLGNKCDITPMLRYRENGLWHWPIGVTPRDFYSVAGLEGISNGDTEVVLELAFTARPSSMSTTSAELNLPIVKVEANDEFKGNGALSSPEHGKYFRQKMQELLHLLRDKYGIQKVHLLPCASNAACVFLGQGFDSYHPELVIYDFHSSGEKMIPRLSVINTDNKCEVRSLVVI